MNTLLAQFLARGLARALRIPESSVKVVTAKRQGRRVPDVRIVDLLGVRVVVQGKIDNLHLAIEDCKETIEDGLADVCFAAAYPRSLADLEDIGEVESAFTETPFDVALVKPPQQLTLEGWPRDSVWELGLQTVGEFVQLLESETIYDEMVGTESAERIAGIISEILEQSTRLPLETRLSIEKELSRVLGVALTTTKQNESDNGEEVENDR